MKTRFLILLLAIIGAAVCEDLNRVWTDDQGRKVKAKLLKVEGESVVLKLPDGREVPYPIAKLSQPDREFIEKADLDKPDAKPAGKTEEPAADPADNFDAPWPDRVTYKGDPEIATIEENADEKKFIYESANYRYQCDVRLSTSVVRGFAVMFETTYQFCRELPLAVNGGEMKDGKYPILLFETEEDYIKEGGLPGSAGVFIFGRNIVMVPLTSLGVQKVGSGYMLDRDKSSKTLPHELVHQLTPLEYYAPGARGWFSEGLAEYIAVTPYRSGSYNVRTNFKPIVEYVTAYGISNKSGMGLGTEIQLGSLETFMTQSYASFANFTGNFRLNYGCGLLITNYFFHMDREGDAARIKNFLKALKAGKEGNEALAVLLDGQTWEQLEFDIAKAYSRKGIDFTF